MNIEQIMEIANQMDIETITSSDNDIQNQVKNIYYFIQTIAQNNDEIVDELDNSNIRFCDYIEKSLPLKEQINYFEENYNQEDKEKMKHLFNIYMIFYLAEDLIYNYHSFEDKDELYEIFGKENIKKLTELIDIVNEHILEQNKSTLENILDNGIYKILFTGYSLEDIKEMNKSVKKSLINSGLPKLQNEYIPLSEAIGRTKDLYNIPIARIHFLDDYRIAYIRKNNVTAILGIKFKTGRNIDYTRYDNIAKNIDDVYNEIELYNNGLLDNDSQHYKVIEELEQVYDKINTK